MTNKCESCPCRSSDCWENIWDCWVAFSHEYPDVWEQVNNGTNRKYWVDVYQGIYESGSAFVKELYSELHADDRLDYLALPFSEIDWNRVWEIETQSNTYFDIEDNSGQVHIFQSI